MLYIPLIAVYHLDSINTLDYRLSYLAHVEVVLRNGAPGVNFSIAYVLFPLLL